MADYKKGQIYQLFSLKGDEIYVGSTTQPLHKRFYQHKNNPTCSSKILFEKYDDVKIELIEDYPCANRKELNRKEGQVMRLNKDKIVNMVMPGRTPKEYYKDHLQDKKQYYLNNIDIIRAYQKDYYHKKIEIELPQ